MKREFPVVCNSEMEEIILCECSNPEHMMLFSTVEGDDENEVFVTFHLVSGNFWQRLKHGIKYIFGYTSKYGDFDELILRPKDAHKFEKVAEHLRTYKTPNYDK